MKRIPVKASNEANNELKLKCGFKLGCCLLVTAAVVFAAGLFVGHEYDIMSQIGFANGEGKESGGDQAKVHPPVSIHIGDTEISVPGNINFDLGKMSEKANELQQMLTRYYGKDVMKKMRKIGMGRGPETPEYKKGLEHISRNIIRELLLGKKYVIGTIGSSVAAAHDNCNYDSYEKQLTRTLSPIWKAAGGGRDFEVRNAGEGGACGDSHRNQIFCIQNMVGQDVDLIHYSWSYFEGRERGYKQHEMLLRWALMMEKAPAVNCLFMGGDLKKGCYSDSPNQKLFQAYSKDYGFNAICLEGTLFSNGRYDGKKWGEVGDGLHNITRYGRDDETIDKHRKSSLGVVWRNWHPGPLGFQAASDMFTMYYIDAINVAIKKIIEKGNKKLAAGAVGMVNFEDDFPEYQAEFLADDLIEPLYCDPILCKVEQAPGCLNLEKPTYGYHQVSIVSPDDTFNPYQGKIKGPNNGGWTTYTNNREAMKLIPKAEKHLKECAHLDACGGIKASSTSNGWAVFKMPKMTVGRVILCGCCGKHVGKSMFVENEFIEITFAGKPLDRATFKVFEQDKCAQVLEKFPQDVDDSGGHIYLGIRLIKDGAPTQKQPSISHIIAM